MTQASRLLQVGDKVNEFNQSHMLVELRCAIEQEGSACAWARKNKLSASYVSDILLGKRNVSAKVAKILGFKREVIYRV